MTIEQMIPDNGNSFPEEQLKIRTRGKRDIFRFNGAIPTAINLEHITHMALEGKKITFNFYSTAIFVELQDEAAAANVFEALLNHWSADVVE